MTTPVGTFIGSSPQMNQWKFFFDLKSKSPPAISRRGCTSSDCEGLGHQIEVSGLDGAVAVEDADQAEFAGLNFCCSELHVLPDSEAVCFGIVDDQQRVSGPGDGELAVELGGNERRVVQARVQHALVEGAARAPLIVACANVLRDDLDLRPANLVAVHERGESHRRKARRRAVGVVIERIGRRIVVETFGRRTESGVR
jgi:hypothetical protein